MRILSMLSLAVALAGCSGETQTVQLEQLESPRLDLVLDATGSGSLQLSLWSEAAGTWTCNLVSKDVTAKLDGRAMRVVSLGGVDGKVGGSQDRHYACSPALFEAESPPASETSTTVEIADSSATFLATYSSLTAPRGLSLVGDAGIHPGDTITLQWTPVTDLLSADAGVGCLEGDLAVSVSDGGSQGMRLQPTSVDGTLLRYQLPADAGTGEATFSVSSCAHVDVARCSGGLTCDAPGLSEAEATRSVTFQIEAQ